MAPKVFLYAGNEVTGVTGYIGGDLLCALQHDHPDWEYTCLVRNAEKGATVASLYPKVKLVYGDLDRVELLEEEAGKSDIIYHTADADHAASAEAFARAMSKRSSTNPAFYIHTSGTGILAWETVETKSYGTLLPRVYDDWDGIGEVISIPDSAMHRQVDKIVLGMSRSNAVAVKTAIVCPPCIYGQGRGPDKQRSAQAYEAAKTVLKNGAAFLPVDGENVWHEVHVHDLSALYVLLGESAAAGGGRATWNEAGYYFAENGSFVWKDIFQAIARIAKQKGLIQSDETSAVSSEELSKLHPLALPLWATNSRARALRARNLLGWAPTGVSLQKELPYIVEQEARDIGLITGHASKVTSG